MADRLSLAPGTMIGGHYIVGALLNAGGFGSVYRGIDTSERNRPCAIKETYDISPSARRQALTEAAILFTVNSPHLPQVYDAFEDQGRFYLVMQLIEGQNLLELCRNRGRPCSEQEVLRWLLPVMDILQELHSRNPAVIHRDIKPGNIILPPDERAVLVDFGLTRLYDPTSNSQTMVRAVSEGFSSLEQYIGKTGPRSDIYSMAATIYWLLTETVPPDAMQRTMRDDLVPPRALNARISPNTEAALLRALALDADHRFASMHEFARALQPPTSMVYPAPPLSVTRVQAASEPTERIVLPPPPPYMSRPAPPSAYGWPSQPQPMRGQSAIRSRPAQPTPVLTGQGMRPAMGQPAQSAQSPSYPFLPPRPSATPPPQAPARRIQTYKALPGAYNQGCLWGMLQGICAALIVLNMKNGSYLNVALAEGFFFYFLAGLFTTRRGGSFLRGIWAGFWAGIISTVMFWVVLLIGLAILTAKRIQLDASLATHNGQPFDLTTEIGRAFHLVVPALANQPNPQQGVSGVIVYLAGGLLTAMMIGLVGGLLGSMWARRRGAVYAP